MSTNQKPNFSNLSLDFLGEEFEYIAKIDKVIQTSGPTLFKLNDGSGILTAKAFVGPGERAYPEIDCEDVIKVSLSIKSYNDELEASIENIKKINPESFENKLEKILKEKSKITIDDTLIETENYNKLNKVFKKTAYQIKKAIFSSRPIIIKHHNDCDGYCAGVSLERSILPLIEEQHGSNDVWKYYERSPSKSPYYDYTDSLRDLSRLLKNSERFNEKKPLIILTDLGSSIENKLSLELLSIYDVDFIVIDHHPGDFEITNKISKVHVNPHKVNASSNITAGMLSFEISRFINPGCNNPLLPVLSGIGDRSSCKEFDKYLNLLNSKNDFDMDFLQKYVSVIDFQAYHLRFIESRYMIDDLLGNDYEKQKEMINLIYPSIEKKVKNACDAAINFVEKEELGNSNLFKVKINEVSHRGYPKSGHIVGVLKDRITKENNNVITIGKSDDMIIFRASDDSNFKLHEFIKILKNNVPESLVEGGGHEKAGTIKFLPASKEKVFTELKKYLLSI